MTNEITLTLTPYQLTYLKELVEQDFNAKGFAYIGIYKNGRSWDRVMLEALINYFDRKNVEHLKQKIELDNQDQLS